jgi:hypothetical protein
MEEKVRELTPDLTPEIKKGLKINPLQRYRSPAWT